MAWGKTITVKFYLNTKLKPLTVGSEELYPLYVSVICKKQVSRFKYFGDNFEPELVTKSYFKETFEKGGLNKRIATAKKDDFSFLESDPEGTLFYFFKKDIEYLLDFLDAFDRDKFSIHELPNILKDYYNLKHIVDGIPKSLLRDVMYQMGYEPIVPIINWKRFHQNSIEEALLQLQSNLKLPKIKVNYGDLPFSHVEEVLEIVKKEKVLNEDTDKASDRILKSIKKKNVELRHKAALYDAIEFYKSALKLTKS
jgi:hypothetical protein